ncbi:MAG TPA: hypothetical protein G4N94_06555 [Caldilineae bacterium]|nr:hypothetical protein [Caldilineae bacterium]
MKSNWLFDGGRLFFLQQTATASLMLDPLPAGSLGMVQISGPVARPVSFLRLLPKYRCGNSFLRVTDTLEFCALANAEICSILIEPNIIATWDQWVSHNVAPGPEAGRPSAIEGSRGGEQFMCVAP